MFEDSPQQAVSILADPRLTDINDILVALFGLAKEKIHAALLQMLSLLAAAQRGARYLINDACPVRQSVFYRSRDRAVK